MKHFTSMQLRLLLACTGAALVLAPLRPAAGADLEFEDVESYGWFVRAGPRALFNISASVERVPTAVTPWAYDNGFVLPDVTGSARTWNWGYQDASQIVGDDVRLQRLTDPPMAGQFNDRGDDPVLGGEILTGAELVRFFIGRRESRVGFEIGYGYNAFTLDERSTAPGRSVLTVAVHGLGGTVPPVAPHTGSFGGPGPQINLSPTVYGTIASASQAAFDGELENQFHTFKFGVWFEYPLARRLTGNISLGYSSMYTDSRLKFTEHITFADPGIPPIASGPKTVSGRGWKQGGYAQLRLKYDLSRQLGVYLGGDFAHYNSLYYQGEGRQVTLDLGSVFAATAGVSFSF